MTQWYIYTSRFHPFRARLSQEGAPDSPCENEIHVVGWLQLCHVPRLAALPLQADVYPDFGMSAVFPKVKIV